VITDSPLQEPPVLDCEQTVRRLWDYLDRQLSAIDRDAVDRHLHDCKANCASHFAFEQAFLDVVREARPRVVASDVVRQRVRSLLKAVPSGEGDADA
jgi:anti-sigma factor RsiW